MTTALVVGLGAVGTRAARQLIDTPAVDRLLLADRDDTQLAEVAEALGPDATAIDFAPGDPIPSDVDVIATALPGGVDHTVVSAAIAAGVPVASSDDEHDAIECSVAASPHVDACGAPLALVTESTAEPPALRRLADLEAETWNCTERVHEQRGATGHRATIASTDRLGEPHEVVAMGVFLTPRPVVPGVHQHASLVANGVDAGRSAPPGTSDPDLVDLLEHGRRMRREHVGEAGRETAADGDRHVGASGVR